MNRLEGRYRAVLRLLPASHRAAWEEEMVATFLDTTRTGRAEDDELLAEIGRPSRAETASVVALAVRLRLGGPSAPPRWFAWGQAVRILALVGLLVNALLVLAMLAQDAWIGAGLPLPSATRAALAAVPPPDAGWGDSLSLLGLGWVAAYLALVTGRRGAARLFAGIALVPPVVATVDLAGDVVVGLAPATSFLVTASWLLFDAFVVLTLAAFHRQAPPIRRRPWLVALAAGTAVAPAVGLLPMLQPLDRQWVDLLGLLCLAWVGAALVPRLVRDVASALAVALFGLVLLALRLVSLVGYVGSGPGADVVLAMGVVQAAAVGFLAMPLMSRSLHRLPPASAPTPAPRTRSREP